MGHRTNHSCMAAALPLVVQRAPAVHLKAVQQLPANSLAWPGSKLNSCCFRCSHPETAWGFPVAPAASVCAPGALEQLLTKTSLCSMF